MTIFNLPDLGEGLPEAQIRQWHIKVGDTLKTDQLMVSVETAKALVDVPSPCDGVVEKLYGDVGDTVYTGKPLIGFVGDELLTEDKPESNTVVGSIATSDEIITEASVTTTHKQHKASPATRALARKLGVDLAKVSCKGDRITGKDVQDFHATQQQLSNIIQSGTALDPIQQAMSQAMTKAHQYVVPASIMLDADITAWEPTQNFMLRLIRAMCAACNQEPLLNSSLQTDGRAYTTHDHVNLGIAIDTEAGLFVPVIPQAQQKDDKAIMQLLNEFKEKAQSKTLPADVFKNATITLSNIGSLSGKYATPIITPPQVAILAAGRGFEQATYTQGRLHNKKFIPLSLTFDHRLITGGQAARFLQAICSELATSTLLAPALLDVE